MSSEKNKINDIISRLEIIRKYYELTQSQISIKLSITQGFYSDMVNRGTGISAKAIIGLALNYPEINLRWFLTGEGEMLEGARLELGEEATRLTEAQASRPDIEFTERSKISHKIVELVESLPEDDQKKILVIVQSMIGLLR